MLTKHLLPFNPFAHRLSAPVDGGEGVFMQNSIIFSIRKQRVLTSSKSFTLDRLQISLVCTRLIAIFDPFVAYKRCVCNVQTTRLERSNFANFLYIFEKDCDYKIKFSYLCRCIYSAKVDCTSAKNKF